MVQSDWTPSELLQLSGGYWSACALHAGVKLDVFTALSGIEMNAAELAGRIGVDVRGGGMLFNALTALGLLVKRDERYNTTVFAADYLCRTSPQYLGHIIMHHHHLMDGWSRLDEAVSSGHAVWKWVSDSNEETVRESFLMGMFNLAMLLAPKIVPEINLEGQRRLLDLGGGPGTYAIHFCQHNSGLTAVVYDLPSTRSFAEKTIERFGLSARISFNDGDFLNNDIDGRFDVAWLSHILHSEGPDGCAVVLKKAMSALEPGGMILVQEFMLDDSQDGPPFPALFSLNMLLGTPDGQAYSQAELLKMLSDAGFCNLQRLTLELPNGAGIIAGSVPLIGG